MRQLLINIAIMATLTVAVAACDDGTTSSVHHSNTASIPTMESVNVQTVISDSGRTRYRITTPKWLMYEEAKPPHWVFPHGIIAEELDGAFNTVTSMRCDSAYYDEQKQLWSMNGNVRISNAQKELIVTNQMYWNLKDHRLYSDSFIRLEKVDRVIEGSGYESNESLTTYQVHHVKAIFPASAATLPQQ